MKTIYVMTENAIYTFNATRDIDFYARMVEKEFGEKVIKAYSKEV